MHACCMFVERTLYCIGNNGPQLRDGKYTQLYKLYEESITVLVVRDIEHTIMIMGLSLILSLYTGLSLILSGTKDYH